MDKINQHLKPQMSVAHKMKGRVTSGKEEIAKPSIPSAPGAPEHTVTSWEKAGERGRMLHSGFLEGRDGILEKLGTGLTKEDIDKVKTGNTEPEDKKTDSPEQRKETIMKQIKDNPEAWQAYKKLSPEEQEKFMRLAEELYSPESPGFFGKARPAGTDENLIALLVKGKLFNKDSKGKTLLDNLSSLSGQKFAEGIDGKSILSEVTGRIAFADSDGLTGGMAGLMAGNETLKFEQAILKNNPSEYVRIISGLTGESGEVTLDNGEVLKRDNEALKPKMGLSLGMGSPIPPSASGIFQASIAKHVMNKEVKPEEKRENIIKALKNNEKAWKAFMELPKEEQEKFLKLLEKGSFNGMEIMGNKMEPVMNPALLKLLEDGKLRDKDSKGKSLLDNLSSLSGQKFAEGIDGKAIFNEVLGKIAYPDMMAQGMFMFPGTQPDPAAKLEQDNIKNNPSEYIRIIAGLTGESGEVALPDGEVLRRTDSKKMGIGGLLGGLGRSAMPQSASRIYQDSIREHLNKKEVTSEEKQKDIKKIIDNNQKAKKAFEEMSQEDKKSFLTLVETTYRPGVSIMGSKIEPQVDVNLIKLLEEGKLKDKDKDGQSLLHILIKLQRQEFAPGLDGKQIFRETVENLANPDKIRQNNKGTCTVTTVEYIHAKNHPAEYARIIAGLTGKSGEVELRNGDTLRRDGGIIADDGSGRTAVDRIYQASMMEYANGEADYVNATDQSYSGTASHPGLYAEEYRQALDGVMPFKTTVIPFSNSPTDREKLEKDMEKALGDGHMVPVILRFGGSDKWHALAVEKIDGEYVYLRNPWGDGDAGSALDGPGSTLPEREAVPPEGTGPSGGHIKMKKDVFYSNLTHYLLPQTGGEGKLNLELLKGLDKIKKFPF